MIRISRPLPLLLAALSLVPGAAAQDTRTFEGIPTIRGVPRDTAAEAARVAALGPGAEVRAWRVPAPIEQIFRMYRSGLNAEKGLPPDSVVPSSIGDTPVTYHIWYHTFADECLDPAGATPGDSGAGVAECRRWRRGKDKEKTFSRSRAQDATRQFIERVVFTWYRREMDGRLTRLRVEIQDAGLAPDWKRYSPVAQLVLESVPVSPQAAPND